MQAKIATAAPIQDMDEAAYYDYIRAGCADEESFLQEYMCQPSDDNSAFIDYALIDSCCYSVAQAWELPLDCGKHYTLGMDIGRTKDITCIFIL